MQLRSTGALVLACTLVAAAIGVIASHALVPGIARLTNNQPQSTTLGVISAHLPLLRGD